MSHPGRLEGKVAIVTGGGAGFGVGIVNKFTFEGAKVLIFDINEDDAKKTAALQPEGSAVAMRGDVSMEADWKAALSLAVDTFGKLDIIVNNAGVVYNACSSIETTEADYDRVMRVNLKSLYWSSNVVIPHFLAEKKGGIFINISSMASVRPRPTLVWYGASKGGLTNATKGLAIEWAKHNIRFNVIHPVAGETSMVPFFLGGHDSQEGGDRFINTIPLGRFAQPTDIGNAVAFLASDEASMITGASLDVDGGRGI
ncbi:4-formylbenzenesulfonate dehydrogenase TsaC1/TsaC2 [Colletotrichum siamense]|uniref:4-formylbenzenesulfonate dehydrogenase TsaC1/TsaC2 n=1 Tax=Colletotrichum siamense TaxID=690259 RepID=UPI001872E927|nr:4-formylbenzenesulfonate dehydrogenase TsaC1/TsaC2 [Colletotrichum siamense]KAF5506343.1 4-formylbenzenesulfonate dehydrogenase TsaC1/TsaC2 [Colletotrichum siamense]